MTGNERSGRCLILTLASVLLVGCATTYSPPNLPADQVGAIEGRPDGTAYASIPTKISQIDGRAVSGDGFGSYPLAPGRHEIILSYSPPAWDGRARVVVVAQAGQIYKVHHTDRGFLISQIPVSCEIGRTAFSNSSDEGLGISMRKPPDVSPDTDLVPGPPREADDSAASRARFTSMLQANLIYPARASRCEHEGTPIVRVHLARHGHVEAVDLVRSSAWTELDREAQEVFFRMEALPGFSRPGSFQVPIAFVLQMK